MRSSLASSMASRLSVIFPKSMKDFLANMLRFGSMSVDSDSAAFIADSVSAANSASVGSASMEQGLHPRIIMPLTQQVGDLSLSLS